MKKTNLKNNEKVNNAVYKMIDFSKDEGQLFIAIKHNCSNNKELTIQLRSRENKNMKISIPAVKYGSYLEASVNVDKIFSILNIKEESVWDIYLYDAERRIDISIEPFKNFMTDYYPMKERLYIVKPYVTGMGTIALFIKKDKITFNMDSFEKNEDNYNLSIGVRGAYINDIDSRVKEASIYFRKRGKLIGKNEYTHYKDTLSMVNSNCINNNKLGFDINFEELLKYEVLPLTKNPLDGFIKITDIKGSEFELPLVVKTAWKDRPYINVTNNIKACLFKNYLDALSICTNSIK